jgi:hypothetical protein
MFLANLAKTITNLPPILTTIEFHHQKSFRSIVRCLLQLTQFIMQEEI